MIKSSRPSIVLRLIRRERLALEKQKSVLEDLRLKGKLKQALSGLPHGDPLRERLLLYSNTKNKSWQSMETISKGYSQRRDLDHMGKSSYSIRGLETKSVEDRHYSSPTTSTLPPYTPLPYRMTESNITEVGVEGQEEPSLNRRQKCALDLTGKRGVGSQKQDASIDMSVKDVGSQVMANCHAPRVTEVEIFGSRPRYLRHNLWNPVSDPKSTVAEWTLTARPLPRPPVTEFDNTSALQTIASHPDLFRIVTPIKVDVLEKLTASHPNRPFVESVLDGLRFGFWPWAVTNRQGYPLTHDESREVYLTEEKELFVLDQIKHEQELHRVSEPFGKILLLGMYCMPYYVVPKPHSTGWRLVNDLSAGAYSLNSMVDHQFVTGYPLDNLSHFGELLLRKRREKPGVVFVAWKSDVSEAYRLCPMHELWQLKQVVRIGGELVVDRVDMFGGCGSGPIFISVNSLVAWVAVEQREIDDLEYVDDSFGVDEEGNMVLYVPYGVEYPAQQARLLELWDEIGIPHKQKKQVFGTQLVILGIEVDTKSLTFTLPCEAREKLIKELDEWCRSGVRKKVKEWQQLAGWVNWSLNVYPLLRPALNNVYDKLKGKSQEARVWVNNAIKEDLRWAREKIDESDGVRLLKSLSWDLNTATCVAKTDACPQGFAFWYQDLNIGFATSTPAQTPSNQITFYECLAVLSVLEDARLRFPSESKILIYSDNFSTVAMFNSLRALPEYNCILKAAVNILLATKFQLRVLHIAGESNDVADALSRGDFMRALHHQPNLTIRAFDPYHRVDRRQAPPYLRPPRVTLGATRI